jgi:ATP-dependent helicase HepA
MPFALGQRWISDTESDLGLGTVVALDVRTVSLMFSASEENRLYARQDAPVTRVTFNVGDTIESHEGWTLLVEKIEEEQGILTYIGTRQDTQAPNTVLREIFLNHQIRFNRPQDKLFAGQIDRMDRFALRYRALTNQYAQHKSPLRGLSGMRAGLIPHQIYIAHEVGRRHAPRVLLADEVGLGKTIEAGMILHQQVLSGRAERILIVVPETLQYQWFVEMLRRFNLHFSIFDESRCEDADLDALNPFETAQFVLCSLSFLRKRRRYEQALEAEWDLLVVDEAHHLEWSEAKPSRQYQVIEGLAENTPGVLLLTATPEQLGRESHFARLRLLDPDRFYDYEAFVEEEDKYAPIAEAVTRLLDQQTPTTEETAQLCTLLPDMPVTDMLAALVDPTIADNEKVLTRQNLIRNLMDRHGTGRVLFRNTRSAIQGFPERHLNLHRLELPTQYKTSMRVANMMGHKGTLEEQVLKRLYPEDIYQEFEGETATWWHFDPRISWLIDTLKTQKNEKILVICSRPQTALTLEQALREREGIRAAVFHEGMSILERDKAAAYFAQQEEGAQVLLCSEIGSEGRNFQFAHHLVMFDLPINPDLLEQRIGRLDRIGQQHDIEIHVPHLADTAQALLAHWYHHGLNAFEETCPAGRKVYEEVQEELLSHLAHDDCSQNTIAPLIERTAELYGNLKHQLDQGRDRLLELHSNGGNDAKALVAELEKNDDDTQLVTFTLGLFDTIGLNQDDKGENALVIAPSEHMLVPSYPGLPDEGCTVTFNRDTALSREDMRFLTWEHPMIQGGIDLLLAENIGTTAVSLLKNKALPVGTLFLELLYVVDAQAPKQSGLSRFLPKKPIRVLLDAKGNNLAHNVEFEGFNRQLSPINRHLASKLVNSVQSEIHTLISHAEVAVQTELDSARSAAQAEMQSHLGDELARLVALKHVNPNIREDEIEAYHEQIADLTDYIANAQIQLDALRLIVVSHQ